MNLTMYPDNTQTLTLTGLTNDAGDLVSSATLTASVMDSLGQPITGLQDVPLLAVSGSPGQYKAIITPQSLAAIGSGCITIIQGTDGTSSISVEIPTTIIRWVL